MARTVTQSKFETKRKEVQSAKGRPRGSKLDRYLDGKVWCLTMEDAEGMGSRVGNLQAFRTAFYNRARNTNKVVESTLDRSTGELYIQARKKEES